MSIVRIGGGLIDDGYSDPDPADRFRAATIVSPEELAAEQRNERIEAAAAPFATSDPPTAQELGIKVADLPPVRQELARLDAWIAKLQRELADLQAGRGALLAKLDVPAATEADIVALEEADKSGLIAWMKSGAKSMLPNLAREHERALLKEKLRDDSYTAQTARAALDAAEEQADILRRQIEIVSRRKRGAGVLALIEQARPLGAKYAAAIEAVRATLAPLMGLADVVDDRDFYAMDRTCRELLPSFGLSTIPGNIDAITGEYGPLNGSTRVEVDETRVSTEAEPWRRLLETWLTDPRAKPSAGL
jgi:hypothetical protein